MLHNGATPLSLRGEDDDERECTIKQRAPLQKVVRKYACYVLACHGGNKSKATDALEVDRRTLHRWEIEHRGAVLP